mgnify:CR=1 FL=1
MELNEFIEIIQKETFNYTWAKNRKKKYNELLCKIKKQIIFNIQNSVHILMVSFGLKNKYVGSVKCILRNLKVFCKFSDGFFRKPFMIV